MQSSNVKPDKTKYFFHQLCKMVYLIGGPNFWYQDIKFRSLILKIHDPLTKAVDLLVLSLFLMEWSAFFLQDHLTEKQRSDLILFSFSQPICYAFIYVLKYYEDNVRYVLRNLAGVLKDVYNDSLVEEQMLKKAKLYTLMFAVGSFGMLLFYGIDGAVQAITTDATFTSIITAWPDAEDKSVTAKFGRIIYYIIWWFFMIRLSSVYIVIIPLTICLSHQYMNLQSYFYTLNDIFENNGKSQEDKEKEYEEAFKVGIRLHSETLMCTKQCQKIFNLVYGGQIILNVSVLVLLMIQMVNSNRSLANTLTIMISMTNVLATTGCFMWNAGDVTIEASKLTTAIYVSGWQHCQKKASVRIRPLLIVAMACCQTPVELRCLGIVTLSYETYLSIVKSSYSVFSVFY